MSWLGAGIGAGVGMAIGGPIGAGIGAWIGSGFGNNKRQFSAQENQTIFFVALCSMLAKMAKADGVICEKEVKTVQRFFDQMKFDSEDKSAAIKIFNNAKSDAASIYDYADQYSRIATVEMREMIYKMLWEVAYADGRVHASEDAILKEIPRHLGIPASRYHENQKGSSANLDESYQILGCTGEESDQEIRKKYRHAVSEYHPDKIQSKGLPAGFIDFANEQTKKLNKAYEEIMSHRKV
jgi:DnaJ like chaperone protein